jgi:hypothetical protein
MTASKPGCTATTSSRLNFAQLTSILTWMTSTTNLSRLLAHPTKIMAHLQLRLLRLLDLGHLYADLLDLGARQIALAILDILGSSL